MDFTEFDSKMKQFADDLQKLDNVLKKINSDLKDIKEILHPAPKADDFFKAVGNICQDYNSKHINN